MKKVIIIGAGPAGLTAAYELLKDKNHQYQVEIFEETNEIGGISRTVRYKNNRMDIGGHRFFSKNQEVMNYWKELMPLQGSLAYDDKVLGRKNEIIKNGPDPEIEDNTMLIRKRVSRIYYMKKFFDYPISLKIDTLKNLGLIRTIKAGFSYLNTIFYKRKENSLEDFFINRFGKYLYRLFFEGYTQKIWGRHPSEISADWGAQRVKGVSIKEVIKNALFKKKEVETSLIEKFWYPKYGPGQLWEELAKKIEELGGIIHKNCKVNTIYAENNSIKCIEYICNGTNSKESCDILISSMPIKDLIHGFVDNNITKDIRRIAEGLPYRDFITIGLNLSKLNLKNQTNIKTLGNIIPDCWLYIQDTSVKMCRIQIFNNWSSYLVEKPEENIWIGVEYVCSENDDIWKMKEEDFKNFAINELISIDLIEKEDVKDYHIEKVHKAYPSYFDTYSEIDKLISFINKYDNLYCIGRNGQHRYNNMDHSMLTAIETVRNIKNNINNKENIWKINSEKQYHEKKGE